MHMRRVTVFCGSNPGTNPAFAAAAGEFGRVLAGEGLELIYGGGSVGLMGVVADAAIAAGGRVVGVIPRALWEREVGHRGLSELHIVETMHERKSRMAELGDAFVTLPGSIGTLDEMFEIWTWAQLGVHAKPLGVLNVAGYFDGLFDFLRHAVAMQFFRAEHFEMMHVDTAPQQLLDRMRSYQAPPVAKWLDRSQT